MKRRLVLILMVLGMLLATTAPAFAADRGGGATIEEFVCFRSAGDQIKLGTGKVITTPSGKVNFVCTGAPIG